ncbi:MAG: aldo/keto reductase, partial [Schwartzia sp.]|nr:aldo/keto reductase [Schwartzia sp. (in: firmicutes)]
MSGLCLGTVQLGMKYGVNNELGRQPTRKESYDVLQAALELGIDCFDTASAYGNAETVLGDFG